MRDKCEACGVPKGHTADLAAMTAERDRLAKLYAEAEANVVTEREAREAASRGRNRLDIQVFELRQRVEVVEAALRQVVEALKYAIERFGFNRDSYPAETLPGVLQREHDATEKLKAALATPSAARAAAEAEVLRTSLSARSAEVALKQAEDAGEWCADLRREWQSCNESYCAAVDRLRAVEASEKGGGT